MSTAPLLEAHALTIETPGGRTLVRELDLCLGRERVAVVGRNGVGKSTLLDVLAGRQEPARGRVVRRGRHLLVPQTSAGRFSGQPGGRQRAPGSASGGAWRRPAPRVPTCCCSTNRRGIWTPGTSPGCSTGSRGGRAGCWSSPMTVGCCAPSTSSSSWPSRAVATWRVGSTTCWPSSEREREDTQRRYLAGINRLVAREEHNAAVRRRRQRKKNVGRIRELKRCPARIKLNDKRSYKQESQGKRRVLQEARIGAAREGAKAARRALRVELPLEVAWAARRTALSLALSVRERGPERR